MRFVSSLMWPLPALLIWLLVWGLSRGLNWLAWPTWLSFMLPSLAALGLALGCSVSRSRRYWIALGFPLSWLLSQLLSAQVAGWMWLVPLFILWLAYPLQAWRDAPLFPTPAQGLSGLAKQLPLPTGAKVLDAGCGNGAGLIELRQQFPQAQLFGVEWSRLWQQWARWRCPWAHISCGDMWAISWQDYDLVYVFQRPETMPRAVEKAQRELRPGAWLVSLEFPAIGLSPTAVLSNRAKSVWLYQISQTF